MARERVRRLSVADIFTQRTLEAISGAASQSEGEIVEQIVPHGIIEMAEYVSKMLGLPSHEIQNVLPCTQFQEDMVLRSLDRPGAVRIRFVYNIADYDVEYFMIAWQECHEAHPALRASILHLEGKLVQAIIKDHAQWTIADSLEGF